MGLPPFSIRDYSEALQLLLLLSKRSQDERRFAFAQLQLTASNMGPALILLSGCSAPSPAAAWPCVPAAALLSAGPVSWAQAMPRGRLAEAARVSQQRCTVPYMHICVGQAVQSYKASATAMA